MIITIIIIWLLLGLIAVWRFYHGTLKDWYITFNESIWEYDPSLMISIIVTSPLHITGGLFTLIIVELSSCPKSWWFTTKDKK